MKSLEFTIFGYPVAQARARFTRAGIMYTPAKTRAWKNTVRDAAWAAMKDCGLDRPFDGPVVLNLTFTLPPPASWTKGKREKAVLGHIHPASKPDIDNLAKAVMDGINDLNRQEDAIPVWRDDCQVVHLVAQKRYGPTGAVRVQVREVTE